MNWFQDNWYRSIGFKIVLYVVATTAVVNSLFGYMNLSIQERHMNQALLRSASQLSETIEKSIKVEMVENRKENAYRIMKTIAAQEGIEKVRIYGRQGEILFSTNPSETGRTVDTRTEACSGCHAGRKPLSVLAQSEMSRIFHAAEDGQATASRSRLLGVINPLYNEADCSSAACHAHPASQKVLGVIDIAMSLDTVDREIDSARNQFILANVLSVVAVSTILVLFLFGAVERPVKELVLGTKRISDGDLNHVIPVSSADEMGHLADSFNRMTDNLRAANSQIQEMIRGLEDKVDERTRELRTAQEQLLHSEKLIAVGKLAATVAHEINNPLAGVFTYIRLMERKIDNGHIEEKHVAHYIQYLGTMRREVERTTAIVRNLLDFTRPQDPVRTPTSILALVDESLALVQNKLALNNVQIKNRMEYIPDIMADPSQLKQVFINIMINACEAMEAGGGVLTITSLWDREGEMVTVGFCDTGVGIPQELLKKVYDPFFTTKEKGTGLGLSVVQGIVSRHGGKIDIRSRADRGTRIQISLPVH